jgi:hypothetical protein
MYVVDSNMNSNIKSIGLSCNPSDFQYVLISLRGGIPMSFGGSEEPAAYGELISIGGVGPDTNKQLSAAISEILETKLSVPPARFYIKFFDVKVCITILPYLKLIH